jgi:hypothetical protein
VEFLDEFGLEEALAMLYHIVQAHLVVLTPHEVLDVGRHTEEGCACIHGVGYVVMVWATVWYRCVVLIYLSVVVRDDVKGGLKDLDSD